MNITVPPRTKTARYLSALIALLLIMSFLLTGQKPVGATPNPIDRAGQVYHEPIAKAISFQENHYSDLQGEKDKPQREYLIAADLNDPTVQIISGKALGRVLNTATVSDQIAAEQAKGRNVVAGINGDMFNISLGTMHYGAPLGLQVVDGELLVGFETIGSGPRYPVFAVDKNRQAMISHLAVDAWLSVLDEKYEELNLGPNPELTIAIDTINRNNTAVMDNKMILFTPQLALNPVVGFDETQASNATFTMLTNIKGPSEGSVKLGDVYEAEVATIWDASTDSRSILIPSDGMILASQGTKADWVKNHLRIGDKVRFSFNLKDLAGNVLHLDQAISAWLPLVRNGQALTREEMLKICENDWDRGIAVITASDKARTALGFTSDNRVIALVYDGGGAGSEGYGVDLPTMAKKMQELGAVEAVSLDGGGSAQMNTRLFGETEVKVVNNPSDSIERPVSNSLLFASSAPPTRDIKEIRINHDVSIYRNGTFQFQVKGQDSNGNPADLGKAHVKWTIHPLEGTSTKVGGRIDKDGKFTAPGFATRQTVRASLDLYRVKAEATVNVVDKVDCLDFTGSGVLAVKTGASRQLHITAFKDKEPVLITNDAAQWTVSPSSMATVDRHGLLTPKKAGQGVVTARVGTQSASIRFIADPESQLIDSFEDQDEGSYFVNGYLGGSCQISAQQAKDGQNSLRVDYDYAGWAKLYNGTINIYLAEEKKGDSYSTNIQPQRFGMWVYGDGQAPWLRAAIKDGNGAVHILNLASRINWQGWQYVSADISADIPLPISLEYFYMVEIDKSKNLKGSVFFDGLGFDYTAQCS